MYRNKQNMPPSGMHAARGNHFCDNVPTELQKLDQWVSWKFVADPGRNKPRKVPCSPHSGLYASSTDERTWGSFGEALARYENDGHDGIGFVFSSKDPYCGIDLDGCIDENSGEPAEWAREIIDRANSYTELSPSRTGLHIVVEATLTSKGRKTAHVEIYDRGRFFTVTAEPFGSRQSVATRQDFVDELYARLAPQSTARTPAAVGQHFGPELPDDQVINAITASPCSVRFHELHSGAWTRRYSSQSEADLALVGIIARFVGNDPTQIDRIFRRSRLYREKWDEQRGAATYGELTTNTALGGE